MSKLSRRNFLRLSAAFGTVVAAPWQHWETEEPPPLPEVVEPPKPLSQKYASPPTMLWVEKEPVYGVTEWAYSESLPYDFVLYKPPPSEYDISFQFTVTHMGLVETRPSALQFIEGRFRDSYPVQIALAFNPENPVVYLMHFDHMDYLTHGQTDFRYYAETYKLYGTGHRRRLLLTEWLNELEVTP